jgi:hypothetical protein
MKIISIFLFIVFCLSANAAYTPNVVTAPGVPNPKTCYYKFGGSAATLAVPTECTTGTCGEVDDSCVSGTPPAYGGADGTYTNLIFSSGTFANSTPVDCECKSFDVSSGTASARDCHLYFDTGDSTWSTNASGGLTLNIHSTTITGVAANSYVTVKCEGRAP